MPIVNANKTLTDELEIGRKLTVVVSSGGSAALRMYQAGQDLGAIQLSSGSNTFGPFTSAINYAVDCFSGSAYVNESQPSDDAIVLGCGPEESIIAGDLPLYWGPATGKSALPKAAGIGKYFYGDVSTVLVNGATGKMRGTLALCYGVGENMKAINSGATNGYGDAKASLIIDGVAYPGIVVDTLDKDYAVLTSANAVGGDPRIGRCPFGDVLTFEFDFGSKYIPPGSMVRYKLVCAETPHNDSGGGTIGAGQYIFYSAQNKSKDVFARATTLTAPQLASWYAAVDTVATDTVTELPGATIGQVGIRFFNLFAETTNPTIAVPGDSKEHGQDDGTTVNYDTGLDIYGLNGETSNILGYDYGIANLGMQTEKASDITDASKYSCRKKLGSMCTNGVWGYFYNDIGQGGAWGEETNVLATAKAVYDTITSTYFPHIKSWIMKTISPSVTSSDYLTSLTGQTPIYSSRITNILNGGMRRGLFGNAGFIDAEAAVTPNLGSGIIEVPSNAVVINTGTGTITVNAASGTTPATTILNTSASVFKREHNGMNIVIPGMGASAGVLRAQMQYIDGTNARLIIRRSMDAPLAIPASFLNSASPMAITFSANNLYIGAEDLIETSGSSYIHFGRKGEVLIGRRAREIRKVSLK